MHTRWHVLYALVIMTRDRAANAGQKKALEVEYEHFAGQLDQPGAWVINYPRQLLAIFDEAARAVGAAHMPLAFGDGGGGGDDPEAAARREFFVRIVGLPIETPLREIRSTHRASLPSACRSASCCSHSRATSRKHIVLLRQEMACIAE